MRQAMTGVAKGSTADKEIGEDLQLDRQERQLFAVGKKIDADASNTLMLLQRTTTLMWETWLQGLTMPTKRQRRRCFT
jgi:hypothetical protein